MAACDEQLDGGLACPALCPQQDVTIRDTILVPELDTAIAGYPPIGAESRLYVTSMGDTLQTRGVARWDSLPDKFRHNNSAIDSAIVSVDSAYIRLYVEPDTLRLDPLTVELYDVDMGGAEENDLSVIATAFVPSRLIGSGTFSPAEVRDSLNVPIDTAFLLDKIQAPVPNNRLRVGVRVTAASQPTLVVRTVNGGSPPRLVFRPQAGDTSVPLTNLPVRSLTPSDPQIRAELADFLLVAQAPPDPPGDVIRVGGLPGRRAYLRFNVPARILDSTTLVRATLLLTQRPNGHSPEPDDSVAIVPFEVTASAAVGDLTRALFFLRGLPVGFPARTDSVRIPATEDEVREFQVIGYVRNWRGTDPAVTPRALALNSTVEGISGRQIDFYSIEAPLALRPRLKITYLPRREEGLP